MFLYYISKLYSCLYHIAYASYKLLIKFNASAKRQTHSNSCSELCVSFPAKKNQYGLFHAEYASYKIFIKFNASQTKSVKTLTFKISYSELCETSEKFEKLFLFRKDFFAEAIKGRMEVWKFLRKSCFYM